MSTIEIILTVMLIAGLIYLFDVLFAWRMAGRATARHELIKPLRSFHLGMALVAPVLFSHMEGAAELNRRLGFERIQRELLASRRDERLPTIRAIWRMMR